MVVADPNPPFAQCPNDCRGALQFYAITGGTGITFALGPGPAGTGSSLALASDVYASGQFQGISHSELKQTESTGGIMKTLSLIKSSLALSTLAFTAAFPQQALAIAFDYLWTGNGGYSASGTFGYDETTAPTIISESGAGQTNYLNYMSLQIFRDRLKKGSADGPEMVYLPGGKFKMGDIQEKGCEWERPVHEVTLDAFAIGRYPVTVGEFRRLVDAKGYRTEAKREGRAYVWDGKNWDKKVDANWRQPYFSQDDRHPVVCVSWNDAVAYCEWLSEQTGEQYSLPTEAEWECACRASSETAYFFGDDEKDLEDYAWYSKNSERRTHPIGEKRANPWGLHDISGNVWEWVRDWCGKYSSEPQHNPSGHEAGADRVYRGGGWSLGADFCRSAFRYYWLPASRFNDLGFRLARRV